MTSKHTTITGILAIVAGVIPAIIAILNGETPDYEAVGIAITAGLTGLGLIGARDHAASSEMAGARLLVLLLLPSLLFLGGCGTQQATTFDGVTSNATPSSQLITDGDTMAISSIAGQPNYTLADSQGIERAQELASTVAAFTNGEYQLIYDSPKTTGLESAKLIMPNGMEVELGGFTTGTEAPYTAKGEWISDMADLAKQMSADQREQFIATVEAVDSIAAAALKALMPVPEIPIVEGGGDG